MNIQKQHLDLLLAEEYLNLHEGTAQRYRREDGEQYSFTANGIEYNVYFDRHDLKGLEYREVSFFPEEEYEGERVGLNLKHLNDVLETVYVIAIEYASENPQVTEYEFTGLEDPKDTDMNNTLRMRIYERFFKAKGLGFKQDGQKGIFMITPEDVEKAKGKITGTAIPNIVQDEDEFKQYVQRIEMLLKSATQAAQKIARSGEGALKKALQDSDSWLARLRSDFDKAVSQLDNQKWDAYASEHGKLPYKELNFVKAIKNEIN